MQIKSFSYVLIISMLCSSCYYNRRLIYFQDKDYSESSPTKIENKRPGYRLQPNDVIAVKVKSSTDPEISDIFNITSTQGTMLFMNPGNLYLEGYSINEEGKIILPILGTVTVKDLTLDEARDAIQLSADKYLNNATVIVRLVSFKVTVLGEVKNPGYHYVFNNQVTVLEALGLAGDLTTQGNRKNVKLMRPTKTGNEVVLLDLTNPDLLKSPYFYLMPNDVLYVEPLKARSDRSNIELLGVVFAAATTAILILNYVDNN